MAGKVALTTVQLRQTTSRLEELVTHAPTVIYSYQATEAHTITYISGNAVALLGFEASDLIKNVNFWEHVHSEDKERIFVTAKDVKHQERPVYDYRFLDKDGSYRWLRDERVLIRNAQGTPLEYICSWSDITDRKSVEESLKASEANYRSLYESMMDAYVSIDLDGRIREFNQAYEGMLGYTSDELMKLSYKDFTPSKWHEFETRYRRRDSCS